MTFKNICCLVGQHKLVEKRRIFSPPPPRVTRVSTADYNWFMKTMYGFTTIEYECKLCNKILFDTLFGDQTVKEGI